MVGDIRCLELEGIWSSCMLTAFSRGRSMKQRVAQYSTAMESIQATTEPLAVEDEDIP